MAKPATSGSNRRMRSCRRPAGAPPRGIAAAGWSVVGIVDSAVLGHRGAKELLLHAKRER
jgi:hypothetical protein